MKIVDIKFDQMSNSFLDISGNSSLISKTGVFKKTIPVCPYSSSSILIKSNNSLTISEIPIAVRSHESEAFSIGFYFKSGSQFSSSDQNVLYDSSNGFGIIFRNGRMIFRVTDSSNTAIDVAYRLDKLNKSYYVVAKYSPGVISLMLDGSTVASSQVKSDFKFKSTSNVDLVSSVSESHIILDKIQVFNYDLNIREINAMMFEDMSVQNPGQIISSDDGIFFEPSYTSKPLQAGFSYKTNKNFAASEMNNVELTGYGTVVLSSVASGPYSGYFKDSFYFPPLSEEDHNVISWQGDSGGIEVEYNTDGGSVYTPLINNHNIPGFSGGDFYYKVNMSTQDASSDKPIFSGLSFLVYDNKSIDSKNSLYTIDTDYNYVVGDRSLPNSHNGYSGLKTIGGGFKVEGLDVRSVEFFYNPSSLGESCLVDCSGSAYSWNASGTITKSNISSIYVNGEDMSSETSISNVFTAGVWHHVLVTFSALVEDTLFFNQTSSITPLLGPDSRFNYIGIYSQDSSSKALEHYNYMVTRVSNLGVSESIDIGSDSFSGFNIDKIILSTQ
jgi:hypothetical protein